MTEQTNKLYFGDNLKIMREYIADESVDLIYLDPPFNSKATYNVLFDEKNGTHSRAQITAFEDTWHWGLESEEAYHEIVTQGPKKLADLIQALRSFLGQNDMMAYLVMMAIRLVEMHRVLKPTGSIYLHCDPTASHYIKLLLDAIFNPRMFINEIVWRRSHTRSSISRRFRRGHDVLLYYAKDDSYFFNIQYRQLSETSLKIYSNSDDRGYYRLVPLLVSGRRKGETGKIWRGIDPNTRGKNGMHWVTIPTKIEKYEEQGLVIWPQKKDGVPNLKYYLEDSPGVPVTDFWDDTDIIESSSAEALGYPTQKPEALLERVIKASSNEGDIVLDPFCGCGTTISVAEQLNRKWVGIDITHLAITLMKHRLNTAFGKDLSPYEVIGDPKDFQGAKALAEQDRFQFEWWALGKVAARPAQDKKKGADSGVDGYIYFFDDNSGTAKKIIVQVKSGGVKRNDIATLKGDLEREKAVIGAFITLEEPTRPMTEEAVSAGFYEPKYLPGKKYPKIQILTIEQLFEGKSLGYPRIAPEVTFKSAQRKIDSGEQQELL